MKEKQFNFLFYNGPIHWICMCGNLKVARLILKTLNVSLYQLNAQNKTGLYYLIGKKTKNVINILKILFEKGFDVDFKSDNGNSILADFVLDLNPDLKVIEFLLQSGANPKIITSQSKTLYERIENSVKNQFFYVKSQKQIKQQIFELFQKYEKIEKNDENIENNE